MTASKTKQKKKQNYAIILTAASLLLGGLTYQFYIVPTNVKIAENRSKIDSLDQQIIQAVSIRDRLPQLRTENERLKQQVNAFNLSFPKEESLASLIITLGNLADAHSVNIGAINRTVQLREGTNIKQVQLKTTAQGTYPKLHAFMRDISRQQRYLSLDKPALSITGDGMQATLTINAYVMGSAPPPSLNAPGSIPGAMPGAMPTGTTAPGSAAQAPMNIAATKTAQSDAQTTVEQP